MTVAALRGVHRGFEEGGVLRPVLCGVDVTFEEGEFVALLGRSGSGKSTLLHLMAGIDLPDKGAVEVAGVDLASMDEAARTRFRRRHVGLVFQFFHLLPTLTVLENVALPQELAGVAAAEARAHSEQLLASVGLEGRAGAFPDVLSGGEQQRVAVARAMSTSPPLVLADEPTGNLDGASAVGVLDLLESIARGQGRAVVMATHSAAAAARCDRVLVVEDGRLTDRGD